MADRDIRSLDVAMLRAFDALMRERSVSRAAARLFLSQPAVSALLRRLRDTFGDPLFTRTAHGVVPTERAHGLAEPVARMLSELAQMVEGAAPFDPADSQRIFRVAGSDHASRVVLPTLATELAALGSGVRVHWQSGAIAALAERLRKGDVDLAVLPGSQVPRELTVTLLYEDHYVLAARQGHPRLRSGATLEAFCALPHVFLGYGSSALDDGIDAALHQQGRQRLAQLAVTTFSQMVDVLAHTDHVAVMPQRVASAHGDRLQLHTLPLPVPDYRLFACGDRRQQTDGGVQWLLARVVRCFAEAE
jgi:DNA-binding transcriptional LysR family regulator